MLSIQDLLSGEIVKRQQPQQDSGANLGTLLSFLANSQQGAARTNLPQLPQSSPVNPGPFLEMMRNNREDKKMSDKEAMLEFQRNGTANQAASLDLLIEQEQDPTRKGYLKQLQSQIASGVPMLQEAGLKSLNDLQGSALKDAELTGTSKEVIETGRPRGTKEFQDFLSQVLVKPATQINMGDSQYMRPATVQEKTSYGIPESVPATFNGKTGEVIAKPVTLTEDQGKAIAYHKGLEGSIESLDKLMATRDVNPTSSVSNVKNYVGDALSRSGIPGVNTAGVMMETPDQQLFNQAKEEAKVNVIHALTGGGYSSQEAEDKANAYLPNWGEDKSVWDAKRKALLGLKDTLSQRSGPGAQPTSAAQPKSIVETRVTSDGRKLVKYSDGTIGEIGK